uniref:Uncharacterized protein n=1 Tax=Anguilla anguilla TaxID=7936 RepID=A0A0E9QH24_ANGAN
MHGCFIKVSVYRNIVHFSKNKGTDKYWFVFFIVCKDIL